MEMLDWNIRDFSGGINEKVKPNLIADNQCVDVQNCIAVTLGKLQMRKGQAKLNSAQVGTGVLGLYGYHYGETLGEHKLIAVFNDGTMYYWNPTTSAFVSTGKTGLNTTAQVLFATCVNYMVAMNGVDAPWKYDGTTVSALTDAPATGKCPVLHKEKLFCIEDFDTIRWSDNFEPESWPAVNVWNIDKGDGDELTALFTTGRELLVCKKRSIHTLYGSDMDDFRSERTESRHGVAGPRAGIVMEPYLYYVSEDGIFRWDGLRSVNLADPPVDTGMPGIPDVWATVNKNALSKAVAGYNKPYNSLWFHVPEGTSTTNNLVLVYNLTFKSWWIFRGIAAVDMIEYSNGTSLKTYTGHATQGYVVEQNTGYNDLGAAITAYYIGKNYDAGDPVFLKKVEDGFVIDSGGDTAAAVFNYRFDGGDWKTPILYTNMNGVRKFTLDYDQWRFFQPKFSHSVLNKDFGLSGMKLVFAQKRLA